MKAGPHTFAVALNGERRTTSGMKPPCENLSLTRASDILIHNRSTGYSVGALAFSARTSQAEKLDKLRKVCIEGRKVAIGSSLAANTRLASMQML